jgi:hypothetical protein
LGKFANAIQVILKLIWHCSFKLDFISRTLDIDSKEGFLAGIKKASFPDCVKIFIELGKEGWLVIQVLTPQLAQGVWTAKTGSIVVLLQREIIE